MKIRILSFLLIIFVFFGSFEIFIFKKTVYASDSRVNYYDIDFDGEMLTIIHGKIKQARISIFRIYLIFLNLPFLR